ncbi:TetR/AcrR family transcriptional regulator [Mesorhizobium australicum]|uniref:TetR/AcrR family transcriptional regulator n=1 Tax=Mesorhizobium australicum TaxID=536018 RepID=A0ACC6T230_9HYPH|nr:MULTISPECIES: TetR/AcrR family transcriptional regulator [unclassified Mesorhizobium]ESY88895.1 TetR family transcriptional regulator [Mesorhizobium sp. LNHC220B00]ESY95964.1 TetR family transcriptional regulator [Mesorhizobium sp. LNHC229A00]ESY99822.1 TetR family transcriptional regulator [Mesorhizobium sp. LNHC209A00]
MALDKEETGERVLAIAEALLNEGGMDNLKARTIAEQAGISVGSVYNLFSDLDGVHRAVNMRLLDRLGGAGAVAMAELARRGITDVRQRLMALAGAYVRFVEAHPGSWPALLAFNRRRPVLTEPDVYEARLDQLFEIIASVLADGGFDLDEDTRRIAARTLWSSVHGIVTSGYAARSDRRQADEISQQIELLVSVFIRGLERGGTFAHAGGITS